MSTPGAGPARGPDPGSGSGPAFSRRAAWVAAGVALAVWLVLLAVAVVGSRAGLVHVLGTIPEACGDADCAVGPGWDITRAVCWGSLEDIARCEANPPSARLAFHPKLILAHALGLVLVGAVAGWVTPRFRRRA